MPERFSRHLAEREVCLLNRLAKRGLVPRSYWKRGVELWDDVGDVLNVAHNVRAPVPDRGVAMELAYPPGVHQEIGAALL